MIEDQDHRNRRCPRLGNSVDFKYCRICGGSDPICWKILDCWWEIFDVRTFLMEHLPQEEFQKLTQTPTPSKINSILDLIEQAKQNSGTRNQKFEKGSE